MERDRVLVFLLGILAVIAVGCVLKAAQGVIVPLVIAWLLSYILGPVVRLMTRMKIPTSVSVLFVLLLVLGICWLVGVFMNARISAFAREYPKYRERLTEIATVVSTRLELPRNAFADIDWTGRIGAFLMRLSSSFFSFMSNLIMVIIFLVFLLLGKPYSEYKIRKAFSPNDAERFTRIMESISSGIGNYLALQFLISFVTGALVWLALECVGVDFAITWGALAFFLNFIPTVGSVIASIPPVVLALVQFYPNYWPAVVAAVLLFVIQMTIGNFLAPKVMGDKLNLSPVVILVSLLLWGWLWGVVGALLSVPIASAVKIICDNIEPLHPIGVMLGAGKVYAKEFQ